jgi:hypothetical protein
MKPFMIAAAIMLLAAPGALAANGTWTGKIGDGMCGLSHKAMIEHGGGKMTDAQCRRETFRAADLERRAGAPTRPARQRRPALTNDQRPTTND